MAQVPEAEKIFVTPRFKLEGGEQRVLVEADAPVDNNWLGLDLELVNTQTNTSLPATLEVSAYHGYDSDGAWSEGSQRERALPFPLSRPANIFSLSNQAPTRV